MSYAENNKSIEEKLVSIFKERVKKNKNIILSILGVILQMGRRNISLRGSCDVNIRKNMGIFQYFVYWNAEFDPILNNYLSKKYEI